MQLGKQSGMNLDKYSPNRLSIERLGSIVDLINRAEKVEHSFQTAPKIVLKLESGELYFDSLLNLDTDGSIYYAQDGQGQNRTSIQNQDGTPIDANSTPYFVLPEHGFYQKFGIKLGDVAAVIYRDKIEFAVFADEYGHQHLEEQLGEGSIALHRSLGHETITEDGRLIDEAIDGNVITIVFPDSGIKGNAQTPEIIREIGRRRFLELGGILP
jgi:Fungal chitosanase of glycosyl hydrolase group 75